MIDNVVVLREAWRSVLAALGVSAQDAIVVGGPPATAIGEAIPVGLSGDTSSLVTLGSGPFLRAGATPAATTLEDASIDAAMLLGAWGTSSELAEVVAEARRVLRPGGMARLGRWDLDAIMRSTPATHRSALMYRSYPSAAPSAPWNTGMGAALELAAVRARFRGVSAAAIDLPSAVLADADGYVDAVMDGLWPGVHALSVHQRTELARDIRRSLRGAIYPVVEYQPWYLVSAVRPA